MTRQGFAANAACVRDIEIAFSLSSLLFVPVTPVGANCRCENLTARASRICRSVSMAIWSGRFVHRIGGAIRSGCLGRDNSWTRFVEQGAGNG